MKDKKILSPYIIIAFMAVFFVISQSFAQETTDPSVQEASDNSTLDASGNALPKEKTIYAKATDEQIKEAQRYYNICRKNESINNLRDCKCAATKFLETRLSLGDSVTPKEIIQKNSDLCLKRPVETEDTGGNIDYSKLPQAYIDEANEVYKYCNSTAQHRINFDCQCFAAEYLTIRQEEGKRIDKNNIMVRLRETCRNVVDTTGQEYTKCMSQKVNFNLGDNVTQKDYCECVARDWARQYENFKGNIDRPSVQREIRFSAIMRCQNPNMYE